MSLKIFVDMLDFDFDVAPHTRKHAYFVGLIFTLNWPLVQSVKVALLKNFPLYGTFISYDLTISVMLGSAP